MQKVKSLWGQVPDSVKRVLHTFWQAAGGVLLQQLLVAQGSVDAKAVVMVAGAAGLAAVKGLLLS